MRLNSYSIETSVIMEPSFLVSNKIGDDHGLNLVL